MDKLRVLQVNKAYYPHIGGIESLVRTFSRELNKRPDTEVQVLVCREGRGKTVCETIEGVPVTRAGSLGTYFSCPLSLSFLRKFRKMAKHADVVEFHMPFPLGDLACLLSGYHGRVVLAWHSDVVKQKKLLLLYKPILMRFLKRADCIITATQGHIDGSAFLPEFREKCTVIPYGIDVEAYQKAQRKPILTEQLQDKNRVKVLFVGRLVYYKGVSVLLKAFAQVTGCELFLVGSGVLEEELRQQAKNCPMPVHFLGTLSDSDLKAAFADCDIFVLPSVANSEAFGIVQQEAMVYGKPVINTSLPTGVPHVSLHEQTGLTVPPEQPEALAQAIQRLAEHPELRKQFGTAGAKRVADCFAESVVLEQVHQTLALGKKS